MTPGPDDSWCKNLGCGEFEPLGEGYVSIVSARYEASGTGCKGEVGDWEQYIFTAAYGGYGREPAVIAQKEMKLTGSCLNSSTLPGTPYSPMATATITWPYRLRKLHDDVPDLHPDRPVPIVVE